MIKARINEAREKLNNLILNGANYEEIYEASKELDVLIIEYYREQCA